MRPLTLFFITLFYLINNAIAQQIPVYIYQDKPPFIINSKKQIGLAYDFVSILNEYSKTKYELQLLPRTRINKIKSKIMLFTNEVWLNDENKESFLYSSPIAEDQNLYISNKKRPIDIKKDRNLKIAVIAANVYVVFKESSHQRIDVLKEEQVFDMVDRGRVDVGVISLSTLNYLLKKNKLPKDHFFIDSNSQLLYKRHLVYSKDLKKNYLEIEKILQNQNFKESLNQIFKKY
ncbi:ABC transporter, substrate-binding protein, family 3 [Bacteriovorax sp. BSW11_IV]|uniref:transporter substrate-binding domain-containing protein n=1 Tax=Bacteriovorax sp. BSW11_IV TaxID=1353529 RepID=UPI000389F34F|nr:transporter substrate-binding domain-containing protein [Bacteriovorax sp. BSW11_IV]EQC49622.1 ABC transporter, substrate-binding protein, family 3 [Bacteriovorax sp. BSW11_IV]